MPRKEKQMKQKKQENLAKTHYRRRTMDDLLGKGIHKSVFERFGNPAMPYNPSAKKEVWVIGRDFDTIAAISPEFSEEDVKKITALPRM